MKKINPPMKTFASALLIFMLFLTACEDPASNNNTPTNPTTPEPTEVETPSNPSEAIPDDGRRPLYLQGVSATSNNSQVDYIFDGKSNSSWKSNQGAASDEGIMFHFQNKIFIKKIEIEGAQGNGIATVNEVILYGDDVPCGKGKMGESINLGDTYSSLFIRFGKTDNTTEVKVEDEAKKGIVRKFSKSHSIGVQNIIMWDEDGKEYRLIPPRKVDGRILTSSTLQSASKYSSTNLFDNQKESAWVEGVDGNGINEKITFEVFQAVNIDAVQIWNGYQRSPSVYKTNARLKGFSLGEVGGKSYEYTLRDDDAGQKIDLQVPLKNKFELKINSAYDGSKYQDLGISEILLFEDEKPLQLKLKLNLLEHPIDLKTKGTNLERLLDTRIANEMDYGPSGFYSDRSIILRSDGTFSMYLMEKLYPETEAGDGEIFESMSNGTWEIQNANATKSIIKLTGKMVDLTAALAAQEGNNEQAEIIQFFTDKLTIENNLIRGEQVLDEIVIR
ncbi:MAG: hypothetical protein AB8F94_22855 [Saprospiraceae bacterium]